jgi:hypothetical protein
MQTPVDSDNSGKGFEALKPARRGALECVSFVTEAPDPWHALYAYGTAGEEAKRVALRKLELGGDTLHPACFLNQDCHELWVGGELIGLCSINTEAKTEGDTADIVIGLKSIFLLGDFRGHGVSSVFIDCIWKDLAAAITSTAAEATEAGVERLILLLIADFQTEEGEGVFSHFEALLDSYSNSLASGFNLDIEVKTDAGS